MKTQVILKKKFPFLGIASFKDNSKKVFANFYHHDQKINVEIMK